MGTLLKKKTIASIIDTYPPNINKFSKFYKCKEYIFILRPGDMLYIPYNWMHWVFSYPDTTTEHNENIAISFPVTDFKGELNNQFSKEIPFVSHSDKTDYPNLSFDILKENYNKNYKYNVLKSKKNTIIPIIKPGFSNKIIKEAVNFAELESLLNEKKFNVYLGQNADIINKTNSLNIHPSKTIIDGFPNSKFGCFLWFNSTFSNNNHVDSGLHYDEVHNVLVQIKGTKIVRMYHPDDMSNLYLREMSFK